MVRKMGIKNILFLTGLLLEFAFTLLGGVLVGYLIDGWLHTKPWFTLVFMGTAIVTSFKILMVILKKAKQNMENEND